MTSRTTHGFLLVLLAWSAGCSGQITNSAGTPARQGVGSTARVVVKLRDSVTSCAHCLHKMGGSYSAHTVDQSNSLDSLFGADVAFSVLPVFRSADSEEPFAASGPALHRALQTDWWQRAATLQH